MTRIHLRQVVMVAADLEAAVAGLREALDVTVCFRDPSVEEFGLHNALMPVGIGLLKLSPLSEREPPLGGTSPAEAVTAAT